jgi:hypothetical protein
MKSTKKTKGDIELATGFTVSDYEQARDANNDQGRDRIADAIKRRFLERYIQPVATSEHRHGFTIMAVSCLMIEALGSFRQGWPDTSKRGRGKEAFRLFFKSEAPFAVFRGHYGDFYTHVRCGILHQAETTGGWVIRRQGPLFEPATHTINATKFIRALERFLKAYCADLKAKPLGSSEWKNVITKMNAIVKNCKP